LPADNESLLTPSDGAVIVEEKATNRWEPTRLRRRIGYVIQEVGLFPHFTVAQNIGLVPTLEGWDPARKQERVIELLDLVGLDPSEYAGRYPAELSGGQRQRIGVARALAADPPLLLMDEPFGALDPLTRLELQRELLDLQGRLQKTIVFVTHDVREAMRLATRIALFQDGSLAFLGSSDELLQSPDPEATAFKNALRER
jgi:osmoprotectant transport system ATP-binding protein